VGARLGQELAASGPVGKIELDPVEPAARLFIGEVSFLQLDHMGIVDLDPAERLWQSHAVGARIQSGAEIENRIDAFGDRPLDESR
jgi:hypothetical protein